MLPYITRRLGHTLLTVFGLSLLVFLSIRLAPGDPAALLAGDQASAEDIRLIRERYRLDDPLPIQYGRWATGILQGDFGTSIRGGSPIGPDLAAAVRVTLALSLGALAASIALGLPLGVLAAIHRDRGMDLAVMALAIFGMSMPLFWISLLLVLTFSLRLGWLPSFGWGTAAHFVLPAATLSLSTLALIARMTRATMVEVLLDDYVRTARSKGLGARRVFLKHALPNAISPVITVIGIRFGLLMGGAVITETIFAVPGLGRLIVQGVSQRDFPVVQSGIFAVALMISVISLFADLLLSLVDPRVRYA